MSADPRADVVVVGAGFAGLAAARGGGSRRASEAVVLEARDRVGGRVVNAEHRRRQGRRNGRAVGRPDPERDRRTRRRPRRRHLPDPFERATPASASTASCIATRGRSRAWGRWRCWTSSSRSGASTASRRGSTWSEPWKTSGRGRARRHERRRLDQAEMRTGTARRLMRVAGGRSGRRARGALAAPLRFYLRSGGGFEMLTDVEGGAQQDRFEGGSQLVAIRAV